MPLRSLYYLDVSGLDITLLAVALSVTKFESIIDMNLVTLCGAA